MTGQIEELKSEEPLFLNRFKVSKTIGEGSYGKVKLAVDTHFGQSVALKIIPRNKNLKLSRVKREIRILRLLHHPHIVKLYDVFETEKEIILSMEHVEGISKKSQLKGGELFNYIVSQKRVKEPIARKMFRQIVSALDYCHSSCIIHRDLKPENLLLDSENNIKIIDFGFVNLFHPEDTLSTFCGSPYYASPEMVLAKNYTGPEVDIWSLGVILYALLSGQLPFKEKSTTDLYKKISTATYNIPSYFNEASSDLIKKILVVDPAQRITLNGIKEHPWTILGCDEPINSFIPPRKTITKQTLDPEVLLQMETFGFDSSAVKEQLTETKTSPGLAIYFLLVEYLSRISKASQVMEPNITLPRRVANHAGKLKPTLEELKENKEPTQPSTQDNIKIHNSDPNTQDGTSDSNEDTSNSNKIAIISPDNEKKNTLLSPAVVTSSRRPSLALKSTSVNNPEGVADIANYLATGTMGRRATTKLAVSPDQRFNSLSRKVSVSEATKPQTPSQPTSTKSKFGKILSTLTKFKSGGDKGASTSEKVQSNQTPRVTDHTLFLGSETVSTKRIKELVEEIQKTITKFEKKGVINSVTWTETFKAMCITQTEVEFTIEICSISGTEMFGIEFKRIRGSTWEFQNICRELMGTWAI